ncbi:FKBP-type peptidyl-prolyl cis-trans isomerase [Bifidobacterium sp. 82T24]|uniref:FKBP-type peptidyl-prolyl cis-trans isomerase n=1 Tax=Bifidobacterium pluvialisilvae TaxID=2834436 RepID=UPI001C57E7E8|nr:FKBP-type peptidyl-prolyl cis-trans isomerase [Bifidobacterium pluvialisilvae]MBW3087552.1 FKBP-type peptidyl-prolyl cis-trans isomerase [Bifidobacterium pluvialisilvae]
MRDFISSFRPSVRRGIAVACAAVLTLSLAACGGSNGSSDSSSSSSSSSSTSLTEMSGITASGKLGEKPKVTFKTPFTVKNATYQILQKGDGDVIEDGDRLCTQQMILDAKSGEEVDNTWDKNTPECGILVKKNSIDDAYYNLFKGMKVNTTIALGVDTSSGSTSSGTLEKYINVMTIVSKSKAITKATGDKVTNIPSDLPKVTLASNGKPSLDLNGYKPGNKLVVQTLIKGKGAKVKETQTVSAHYTGWLASNGKQFDSSWDRGEPSDFALNQVVKGWTQGLTGQTVGSQVLLVIPPSLGYGSQAQNGIPANSTLIFVVDILAAY